MIKDLKVPENMQYIFDDYDYYLTEQDGVKVKQTYNELCRLEKNEENRPLISGLITSALYWLKVAAEKEVPVNKGAYEQAVKDGVDVINSIDDRPNNVKGFCIKFKDGIIDKLKTNVYPDVFRDGYVTTEMIELAGEFFDKTPAEIKFELETISGNTCPPSNIVAEALMEASHANVPAEQLSISGFAREIRDNIQHKMIDDACVRAMIITLNGVKIGYKRY